MQFWRGEQAVLLSLLISAKGWSALSRPLGRCWL